MINATTVLSVLCLGLLVFAGVLLEARRRYLKARQDQHFCRLSRDAMLWDRGGAGPPAAS